MRQVLSTSGRDTKPFFVSVKKLVLQSPASVREKKQLGKIKMASSLNVKRGERSLTGMVQITKASV